MNRCLVTKLGGIVVDDSLLKAGEMAIAYHTVSNPTKKTQVLILSVSKETSLRIVGEGYFTDETLSENQGKNKVINGDENYVYSSNGDYKLIISDKYSLTKISTNNNENNDEDRSNRGFDIDVLKYSKGLKIVDLHSKAFSGDISVLSDKEDLTQVALGGIIDSEHFVITGDISSLANKDKLISVNTAESNVSGNISFMKTLPNLLNAFVANLQGDISSVANTKMSELWLYNCSLTGELSTMPNTMHKIIFQRGGAGNFTWSATRPTSYPVFSFVGQIYLDKVDDMLINQASCVVSEEDNLKQINVIGNRTAASDSAIATLQSKGYTVTITPA